MIRPDGVSWSSLFPAFINQSTASVPFVISGTLAAGAGQNFGVAIPYAIGANWVDCYCANNVTGNKIWFNNSVTPTGAYQFAGLETVVTIFDFDSDINGLYSPGNIRVVYNVNNNDINPVTLITQTITVTLPLYQIPL